MSSFYQEARDIIAEFFKNENPTIYQAVGVIAQVDLIFRLLLKKEIEEKPKRIYNRKDKPQSDESFTVSNCITGRGSENKL